MSSASHHPHPPKQLPPAPIPLDQLPSASIVQLPPTHHVPKVVTTSVLMTTTASSPLSRTTTTHPTKNNISAITNNNINNINNNTAIPTYSQQHHIPDGLVMTQPPLPPQPMASLQPRPQPPYHLDMNPVLGMGTTNSHTLNTTTTTTHFNHAYPTNLGIPVPMMTTTTGTTPTASAEAMGAIGAIAEPPPPQQQQQQIGQTQVPQPQPQQQQQQQQEEAPQQQQQQQPQPQLSDKKLRRLEKNRLSARECRRRKREATEDMEQEIYRLEGENLKLRLQLRIGEEAEENICREQEKVTEEIEHLLKSGASEGEIYATIEDFKEKFADYGRDRRSAIEFHLQNVERLLQPTQTTSVAMRALEGGNKLMESGSMVLPSNATTTALPAMNFATTADGAASMTESPTVDTSLLEPKKLFSHLVNYLQVTPEQAAALKDSRLVARELDESLNSALDVLEQLRHRLRLCGNGLETEFDNVRSVLTPTQAAKFLVWVADNRACMHMLNELWSRVYPDPDGIELDDDDKKPEGKMTTSP